MAPPLSKDLRDRVVEWRKTNKWSYRKLADVAQCSVGTIANILMFQDLYGQSTNPFGQRQGRPPLLDADDLSYLDILLKRNPTIYLDEIQSKLREDRDIEVSLSTIQRTINRLDITRKMRTL